MKTKLPEEENQKWTSREEAETNWGYGERPGNRGTKEKIKEGLFLVDKPQGPTSHQVSAWVKKGLQIDKAGHAGTLDPGATGLLPVMLSTGTKVAQALKELSKEYIGVMELDKPVDKSKLQEISKSFVGTSSQVPPELSAVKRKERDREIYYLKILEVKDNRVLFKIGCESGFYVRVFCRKFGKKLDQESELTSLRRSKVGSFKENETYYLQDLVDEHKFWQEGEDNKLDQLILPVEAGIRDLKKVMVKDNAISSLCHGADLGVNGIAKLKKGIKKNELIAILSLKGELVALSTAEINTEQMVKKDKGSAASLKRVFMDKNKYPKKW